MSPLQRIFTCAVAVLALLAIGLGSSVTTADETRRIVLLKNQETAPYQDVLKGFRQYLTQQKVQAQFEEHLLQGDPAQAGRILQTVKEGNPHVLLTVGSWATQMALQEASELPIIACLIVNADELRKAPNATGVVVDFPLEIQFQWLQRFLPGHKTVGVLFDPKENSEKIATAAQVARSLGLKLAPQEVETPRVLPNALDNLAKDADVLWEVTDKTVLSPQTAEPILLFSFLNRIPLAGLSKSWVKAGALYALDRDYADLGAQCGEMALKVLQGARAGSLPPTSPRKVTYALNLKTASHMKLDISQSLIDNAQEVFQ